MYIKGFVFVKFTFGNNISDSNKWTLKYYARDFPGGPVVRTPRFQCRGHGFQPGSGNKDPTCCVAKKKKKKKNMLHNVSFLHRSIRCVLGDVPKTAPRFHDSLGGLKRLSL